MSNTQQATDVELAAQRVRRAEAAIARLTNHQRIMIASALDSPTGQPFKAGFLPPPFDAAHEALAAVAALFQSDSDAAVPQVMRAHDHDVRKPGGWSLP